MDNRLKIITDKLIREHSLSLVEYEELIELRCDEAAEILKFFGNFQEYACFKE